MGEMGIIQRPEHWSFAPGYSRANSVSGVATISTVKPLSQCRLTAEEPWLRTAKATMVTHFSLLDSAETLLVINIHMINFAFGQRAFRRQLQTVESFLADHNGPVIFSGYFNTWRQGRYRTLLELTAKYHLEPIEYSEDHRSQFMGSPLDHIFTGGLRVNEALTHKVGSSDHNPITVRLSVI